MELSTKLMIGQLMIKDTYYIKPFEILNERVNVIVGDDKQPDFKPQVKFHRWDNECNLSIRLKTSKKQTPVEKNGKISTGNTRFYEVEDGYEFEVILDKKPKSNVVEFTLEDKGVTYHYQSPLTKREIEAGHIMPENIIGSYSVYTDKVGGKYKVGKFGHIYRPEIIDASGNKVWGKLHIENKILSVTVPQEFLDKAKYPVIVDPTFGYTTAGATAGRISATPVDYRQGDYFTAPASGTLDSLHASLALFSGTNFKAKGFVNKKDSVASGSHEQIATAEITNQTGSQSWRTFTLNGENIVEDADYILNVQGLKGENAQFFYDKVDYNGSNSIHYLEFYSTSKYASPESPWVADVYVFGDYISEWELGVVYDPDYIDGDDSCTKAGAYPKKWYYCTVKHTSSADTEPGVGADWEDYWGDAGNIYTERYSVYATYTLLPPVISKVVTDWNERAEADIKSDLKLYGDSAVGYAASDVFYPSFDGSANLEGKNNTDYAESSKNTTNFSKVSKKTTSFSEVSKNTTSFSKVTKNTTDWA